MVQSVIPKILNIFKDPEGRIVIWQPPNLLLIVWVFCKLLVVVVNIDNLETGFSSLGSASLFAWAYLEARSGVNIFRKTLGLIVACVIIWTFFM
jgi:hypothetical protein